MIKITNLQYRIGDKSILEDINLEIPRGVFAAIIGPNGAGKSTLIKLLLGTIELKTGEIEIDGIPQKRWLKENSFGYLPQREEYDPLFPATALDIVLMGIAGKVPLGRHFSAAHKAEALEVMRMCGIQNKANELIGNLSGGEFQRLLLARAIITKSEYLILDEPEAGIDRPGVTSFFKLLKQLNEQGKTIITVSHDLNTLSEYCSLLICLNRRLHFHNKTELVNAEIIHKTFGESIRLIDKDY
nr:zinc transport system ATP-binding protein [Candidatus Cloacimonadota bacterium]